MGLLQVTTPIPRERDKGTPQTAADRAGGGRLSPAIARLLGTVGLLGVLVTVFLISAGAASAPSQLVPGRSGGWPGWLSGPFAGIGVGLGSGGFQTLMLIMSGSYVLVLVGARALRIAPLAV